MKHGVRGFPEHSRSSKARDSSQPLSNTNGILKIAYLSWDVGVRPPRPLASPATADRPAPNGFAVFNRAASRAEDTYLRFGYDRFFDFFLHNTDRTSSSEHIVGTEESRRESQRDSKTLVPAPRPDQTVARSVAERDLRFVISSELNRFKSDLDFGQFNR